MFRHEGKCYRRLVFDEEEEYTDYIEKLSAFLQQQPTDTVALNNRGVAYFELGRLKEAEADLQRACSNETETTPFLNLAEVAAAQGYLDRAIAFASKAIELAPTDSFAYAVRAGLYDKNHQATEAEQDRKHAQSLRKA